MSSDTDRFKFLGHALRGDGPFRPVVKLDQYGKARDTGQTYLIRYPREDDAKFARRNQVSFYESPLHRCSSRFVSHISKKAVAREISSQLMTAMADDIDLKGNSIDVFWQDFMLEAKARGSMLLLVDMPTDLGQSLQDQIRSRRAPYWTPIDPAKVKEYQIDESGRFSTITFRGTWYRSPEPKPCYWTFDTLGWRCVEDNNEESLLGQGEHPIGECPVLAFTENGDYPCFGSFAAIADLAKRLFNLDSELDEILRAQTFSILTMGLSEGTSAEQMMDVAQKVGETIGTNNMMLYTGSAPGFIAPPDGPAQVYMKRIESLEQRIRDIGLEVATPTQRESGIALQRRFEVINAELAKFSERVADLERRAWSLSAKWLQMDDSTPMIEWPRDFNVSDVSEELDVLAQMQASAMPEEVIQAQQARVVATQFDGADEQTKSDLMTAIQNRASSL